MRPFLVRSVIKLLSRRVGWITLAGILLAGTLATLIVIWLLWRRFPPTDSTVAWTMVAGIGAVLTAIATVSLSAFAFRGLMSLRLTRIEMVERSTKETTLIAIRRLEEIANEIIPMNTPILDALSVGKVKVFLGKNDVVQFDPDPKDLDPARAWKTSLPPGAYNLIVGFLNRLEAWSVYFTAGVADHKVAFGPIAPVLRTWVGQYYPILLLARAELGSGTFPNLIKLYTVWSARMDEQQLARLHHDLVGQMDRTQSVLAQARLPDVGPNFDR